VLIADETGEYAPLGLAEALAQAGAAVEVVTPAASIGAAAAAQLELPHLLPRVRRLGVVLTVSHEVERVEAERVVLRDVWSGGEIVRERIDTVVLAIRRRPRDELYASLRGVLPDVRVLGDARAPRSTVAVVVEAEELGRAV
jgi:hypothetical protein